MKSKLSHFYKTKADKKTIDILADLKIFTLYDLLWIFPLKSTASAQLSSFENIDFNKLFIGRAKIINIQSRPNFVTKKKNGPMLYHVFVTVKDVYSDKYAKFFWFNSYPGIKSKLEKSTYIDFLGKPELNKQNELNFNRPEFTPISGLEDQATYMAEESSEIRYPKIPGFKIDIVKKLLDRLPLNFWKNNEFDDEHLSDEMRESRNWPSLKKALEIMHFSTDESEKERAISRLKYEEMLQFQLKLYSRRNERQKVASQSFFILETQFTTAIRQFPFSLTKSQQNSIDEIRADLAKPYPMMRMIQGDVGSGKTAVAMMASMIVATAKKKGQVALMCPTEVLARQHFQNFQQFFSSFNLKVELLTSSTQNKKIILTELAHHQIDIIIGTHSLISEKVKFQNLGLAIIDEQHKFGVNQRQNLQFKLMNGHVLIMTATPIPRSLSLTLYGDMDLSILNEMPPGKKGVKTRIVQDSIHPKYLAFIKTRLTMGEQIYLVAPAIDDNDEMTTIESMLTEYQRYFPDIKMKSLHGRLKIEEKNKIIDEFRNNEFSILLSTSIIEVGIDIHQATVIAIHNPERFGLASLHQLRGRVGRGKLPGFCFLVANTSLQKNQLERLSIMEKSSDGFIIAEEDLKLRGAGEIFGENQSGAEGDTFIFSEGLSDLDLIEKTKHDITHFIYEKNPLILNTLNQLSMSLQISAI